MKKERPKDIKSVTVSETTSKKNPIHSFSDSNTIVKNDPFLNV